MEYVLKTYGQPAMVAIVCFVFAAVGIYVGRIAAKYLNTATKWGIATQAMQYVEQVYKMLHGEEKMQRALEKAAEQLKKIGIPFDANEIRFMIEAAVGAFNASFGKGRENDSAALPADQEVDSDPLSDVLKEMPMHQATFDENEASGLLEE